MYNELVFHCSCLTIKDFAVQAEMVAVETSIDVGNILWIFYDCLYQKIIEDPFDVIRIIQVIAICSAWR